MSRPSPRLSVAAFVGLASCRSLSDLDIRYEDCLNPELPYLEQFDDDAQTLLDRCWSTENVAGENVVPRRKLLAAEGDLILGYSDGEMAEVPWTANPPMLVRRVEGDFVLATKVEVTSGSQSNFCGLGEGDMAGIVVLRPSDSSREASASFLVRPHFDRPGSVAEDCLDNAPNPPTATAEARGSSNPEASKISGIGFDGEADIAVCRFGSQLLYYYRQATDPMAPWQPQDWRILNGRMDDVGAGPLEVGLATTLGAHDYDLYVQGNFNWVALLREGEVDDCLSPLEDFLEPASD